MTRKLSVSFIAFSFTKQSDKHLEGKQTYGGYSTSVVVDEKFVLRIPENLDEANCTAIMRSYWSPLRHWNVKRR
jgi:uncharacterized zinc-type alcohol dehydrogenase-like protein